MKLKVLAAALFLTASVADAQQITYAATRGVGTGNMNLSITTDGTLGVLGTSNIVDWTVTVTQGSNLFTLLSSNSQKTISGNALSATSSDLLFDFDAPGLFLLQAPSIGSGQTFWCVQGGTAGCFDFDGSAEGILATTDFSSFERTAYSGVRSVATAQTREVPEPSTFVLSAVGVLGLAGVARRRRAAA